MSPDAILAVLLALPAWYQDVGDADRPVWLAPVASAISRATESRAEVAALVALGFHESRYARYVVDGRCSDGPIGARCDNGRARTPWQVWRVACPVAWTHPDGSQESLDAAARCAAGLLRGGRGRCRGRHPAGDLAGAFSAYRGASCTWSGGAARARSAGAALVAIEREEHLP